MKRVLCIVLLFLSANASAVCVNEDNYRADLYRVVRSLLDVPFDRQISFSKDLESQKIAPDEAVVFLEQLSEDRIFSPLPTNKKNPCPDQIIRLYHGLDHDDFRKCNVLISSDAISLIHTLLYRHCTVN